jgi:hypothetical protein
MSELSNIITKKQISYNTKLSYLIAIPCVNRSEKGAIDVIERTFESFEKSGMFQSHIKLTIMLFESGSKDTSYLNFLKKYNDYGSNGSNESNESNENNIKNYNIQIIYSSVALDGNSNTLRMFFHINKLPSNLYDFVIWMDDDVFVCKKFIENADIWIKNYSNFSLFSSLYVPYNSFIIPNKKYVQLANLPGFYGTCCTIFKPTIAKYVIPTWYDEHFEKFSYNPDTRFRDSLRKRFPKAIKICVSSPSLVQHMNIGSAIKHKKKVSIGHKTNNFIGEDVDPELYINDIYDKNNNININNNNIIYNINNNNII